MAYSVEEFADAVIASMKLGLPMAIVEQQARYAAADLAAGREIPLAAPRDSDYFPGSAGPADFGDHFPLIEVAVPDLAFTEFALGGADSDATLALVMVGWDSHPRFEILYRKLYRLASAMFSVARTPGALPGGATILSARQAWRSNPEIPEREDFLSGTLLALEVQTTALAP